MFFVVLLYVVVVDFFEFEYVFVEFLLCVVCDDCCGGWFLDWLVVVVYECLLDCDDYYYYFEVWLFVD